MTEIKPCLEPNLCEDALGENCRIDPLLREWLIDKHQKLTDRFGPGMVNFNTNRAYSIDPIVNIPQSRIRKVLRGVFQSKLITIEQTERRVGNIFWMNEAGRLATLALLAVDQGIGSTPGKLNEFRFEREDLDSLITRTIEALGQSCISCYYNLPENDPRLKSRNSSTNEFVESDTILTSHSSIEETYPLPFKQSPVPLISRYPSYSQQSETNNKTVVERPAKIAEQAAKAKNSDIIKGVNAGSFSTTDFELLKRVNLSQLVTHMEKERLRNAPTDTLSLPHAVTIFLEYFGNIIKVDRAALLGLKPNEVDTYQNDTDLLTLSGCQLTIQIKNYFKQVLSKIPESERPKYENPTLLTLLNNILRSRKAKNLPF